MNCLWFIGDECLITAVSGSNIECHECWTGFRKCSVAWNFIAWYLSQSLIQTDATFTMLKLLNPSYTLLRLCHRNFHRNHSNFNLFRLIFYIYYYIYYNEYAHECQISINEIRKGKKKLIEMVLIVSNIQSEHLTHSRWWFDQMVRFAPAILICDLFFSCLRTQRFQSCESVS